MTEIHDQTPVHKKPFLQDTTRLPFAFGLMTGVALLSTVGFFVLLARSTTGKTTSTTTGTTTNTAGTVANDPTPTGPVTLPEVTNADHITGNKDAKVTIMEFSDFQCPFCQQFHPTVNQLLDEYGDKIRVVYKHFPLESIHPMARPAALASECAAEQNKFWEFADVAFTNQTLFSNDYLLGLGKTLGLNETKYKECFNSKKYDSRITSDYTAGTAAGVTGTPTSFVNGTPVNGAQPYAQVKALVDAALAAS